MALLVGLGCGDDGPPSDASVTLDGPAACPAATWSPEVGTFERWPEPALLEPDDASPTGFRLRTDPSRWAEAIDTLGSFAPALLEELEGYDGFGLNAEAYFRFDGPVVGVTGGFATLAEGVATPLPSRVVIDGDGNDTVFIVPTVPLPEGARVIAWAEALPESCASAPALAELDAGASAALESAGLLTDASRLVGLSVFPTATVRAQSVAVAELIAESPPPTLVEPPVCEAMADHRFCTATIVLRDFRGGDGSLHPFAPIPTETATHEVPIAFWLPLEPTASAPTILFGHGLASRYQQGEILAARVAPVGMVTVGMPALAHTGHPTQPVADPDVLDQVFDFFTLDPVVRGTLDTGRLRDHFRQTVWERLQVFRFLASEPDLDGDDAPDVDASRLGYVGGSLGAIMGTQLLAGANDLRFGVLAMPGGRLANILTESRLFGTLFTGLRPESMTTGDLRRFLPLAQTVLDPGDPSTFAAAALREHPEPRPHLLAAVALNDEIVPNASSYDLTRALAIPVVGALEPVEGLESLAAPLSANLDGTTAGLIQVDRVVVDGEEVAAQHRNMPINEPAIGNFFRFVQEGVEGVPAVRDPYEDD